MLYVDVVFECIRRHRFFFFVFSYNEPKNIYHSLRTPANAIQSQLHRVDILNEFKRHKTGMIHVMVELHTVITNYFGIWKVCLAVDR